MKGITPVIAIILLLLMAVAAAGGFYFVYQQFSQSGEESGSSQIDALGEQTLSQIKIESAAGGRIYIRNTGATTIDASKLSVFVDNVPVSVNTSSETLAENRRVVLKVTQAPSCNSEKCRVKISGPASVSQTLEYSTLVCSSDADCLYGETCESGICVTGSDTGECGDGICSATENGEECFEDCGPRTLLLSELDLQGMDFDIYELTWNGTTYLKENITLSSASELLVSVGFDSQGNILELGGTIAFMGGDNRYDEVSWAYHDGSWSGLTNLTDNEWYDNHFPIADFNSSDEAIAVWETGGSGDYATTDVAWASFDGSWSEVQNVTNNDNGEIIVDDPAFAFAEDDTGMAIWSSESSENLWINYSRWTSGWTGGGTILSLDTSEGAHHADWCRVKFNSTHALAVWVMEYDISSPNQVLQWTTWDGSDWSPVKNFSDTLSEYNFPDMTTDMSGTWLLSYTNDEGSPPWPEWYKWEDGWLFQGNLTGNPTGESGTFKNHKNAIFRNHVTESGGSAWGFSYWDGSDWTEPTLFDWVE